MTLKQRLVSAVASAALGVSATSVAGPTGAAAPDERALVCGADSTYVSRRLASDHADDLCRAYAGKVVLVVNTASRCAFTDQYDGLEKLYRDYASRGLAVIGFPSNDFGNQEPGSEATIKNFCRLTYGVEFPMYAKTRVTGAGADPFYRALTRAAGEGPRWNFHKYLIDREGRLAGSYGSHVEPESETLIEAIERLL